MHLADVLVGERGFAERVRAADKEGHWHLVDLAHVDGVAVVDTVGPLLHRHWLVEAVVHAELGPVLL